MDTIIGISFIVSAIIIMALTVYESFSKTKNSIKWLKGFNLKKSITEEEVFNLLSSLPYPMLKEVFYGDNGKIIVRTEQYDYPTEIMQDENGNTIIGFTINFSQLGKRRSKKVASDWDMLYSFLQEKFERNISDHSMQYFNRYNLLNKIKFIASGVLCVSTILFIIIAD